ncbi:MULTISPECIES: hypothetical protein [Aurantimonas]|uniref:hypothetical protein n=1 Tax=Aurantimonas TaxID=182269 RepID=UPI000400F64E|nr:hypothetical protein [Aurantimonas coralicida]
MRPSLLGSAIAALAMWSAVVPASAEDNTLTILQTGTGNSLFVDQSQASGSTVGGLSLGRFGSLLSLDESSSQLGGNNRATITVTDDGADAVANGGEVYLYQNNTGQTVGATQPGGARVGNLDGANVATINALNGSNALVGQYGVGNNATVNVTGPLSGTLTGGEAINGTVIQVGNGNLGSVNAGAGTQGTVVQLGSGNTNELNIEGSPPGTSVVYTQIGNNLTPGTSAQVFTTVPGTVTVTQTGFGSVATRGAVTVTQTAR